MFCWVFYNHHWTRTKRCLPYCADSLVSTPAVSLKENFLPVFLTAHALKSCEKVWKNVGKVFSIKGNSRGDICLLRHCGRCSVGPDRTVFFTSQSYTWQQNNMQSMSKSHDEGRKKYIFPCLYFFYTSLKIER